MSYEIAVVLLILTDPQVSPEKDDKKDEFTALAVFTNANRMGYGLIDKLFFIYPL